MKKMNNKGFSLVELIVVVAIMAVLMAVLVPTLIRNVEKTRVQKDKSAISEIHRAIEIAITDDAFLMAEAGDADGVTVNTDGEIVIAGLFADDDVSAALADEVALTVGEEVRLTSKMREDCVVTIAELNTSTGVVILNVESEEADQTFFINSTGENAGSTAAVVRDEDEE